MADIVESSTLPLREVESRAVEAMEAEAKRNGAGIPPLMINKSDENRQVLHWIGHFLTEEISTRLAMTDPDRYRQYCRLRMEMILRGTMASSNVESM
jgi:hypothetical protein